MTLFPLDSLRNASIDRDLELYLEDVRESLLAFPFDPAQDPGTLEEVVEAFDMARPRLNVLAALVRRNGGVVADISCGLGFLSVLLQRLGLEVIATERDLSAGRFARAEGVDAVYYEIGRSPLPIEPGSLDVLVLSEVLEHVKRPPIAILRELAEGLKNGGVMLLTTPNIARLAHIELLSAGENFLEPFPEEIEWNEDPTDHIEHVREYSVREVVEAVEDAGLEVEQVLMTGWGEAGYQPLPNPFANEIIIVQARK